MCDISKHVSHEAVSRALSHMQYAQDELERALKNSASSARQNLETSSFQELECKYRDLQRDYDALRAQYQAEKQTWYDFKRWWKQKLQAKREARRTLARDTKPILSPRKAREQIQSHRQHVRTLMQVNPSMFKVGGRYAASGQKSSAKGTNATEANARSAGRSGQSQSDDQNHPIAHQQADCACCQKVRMTSLCIWHGPNRCLLVPPSHWL